VKHWVYIEWIFKGESVDFVAKFRLYNVDVNR